MMRHYVLRHKRLCIALGFLAPICLSLFMTFVLGYRVLINTTHSLPHTFYLTNPSKAPIKCGDFIAFKHASSPNIVVKKVVGVAGDVIGKTDSTLFINGQKLNLKSVRANGTVLTPLKDSAVKDGTLCVAGDHINSFDSRYEEFGLVPLTHVRWHVWPIF